MRFKFSLKKSISWVLLVIAISPVVYLFSSQLGIADPSSESAPSTGGMTLDTRFVENVAFGVGEKFTFDVNYGFINAGTATMEVASLVEFEERPSYQIVTRANSNDFFSGMFKVDDRVESIMDAAGLFSWRFEKRLREGGYSNDRVYVFDQRNFTVDYEDSLYTLEPFSQDALTSLYYVRTQPLQVGKSVFMDSFVDGKILKLEVKVVKKEKITVDAGTFNCFVVEPLTAAVGVFKNEGKITIWLTDDYLRMPVLMKSKVLIGSISAELTKYSLGEISEF
ncbi:MAG: DUF3108 domain-containing protein [candidate division Zixibacteria bacterium]|nr:DUF3108 domain-containing protein [candidate division Zixibacteria bacterium]